MIELQTGTVGGALVAELPVSGFIEVVG